MTVVYSNTHSYRNPHCAICNHKSINEVSCRKEQLNRQKRARKPSYDILVDQPSLVDINPWDGGIYVGKRPMAIPACPSGQVYDVFFKRCRQLVCALPGYFIVNRRCVKGWHYESLISPIKHVLINFFPTPVLDFNLFHNYSIILSLSIYEYLSFLTPRKLKLLHNCLLLFKKCIYDF